MKNLQSLGRVLREVCSLFISLGFSHKGFIVPKTSKPSQKSAKKRAQANIAQKSPLKSTLEKIITQKSALTTIINF